MRNNVLSLLSPNRTAIQCSHCGSTHVRPSQRSTGHSSHTTYRCQSCKRHFRVSKKPIGKRTIIFGASLLFLSMIGLILVLVMGNSDDVEYQPRIDTSDAKALSKIQIDAERGNIQAQYDLGWAYWQRNEYEKALPWLKAAANHDHADAEYLLGTAYLTGHGVVQNYRSALEHFTKAAHNGHLEAQFQLGIFHRDGLGATPNKETAYLWLNIAAARGHADALHFRDKLGAVMTGEELARAQEASTQTIAKLDSAPSRKP